MPGLLEHSGPSYLSSPSADVILSEVRPTRLRNEALKSLNALLDELLFNILKNASSFSTDKLKGSLLGLLPTSLGKEALLEAEVELQAYYDQMGSEVVSPLDDDSRAFNLQYAFEVLRLKCVAYSTLNDSDEDPRAESRVTEKMRDTGAMPFSTARIASASLYLTAIVEAMCEHILSNVARVTARDSSRTDATANDLFVALCEDEAIYGMFKSMKAYEQIEQLSTTSQHQRAKSFLRGAKHSVSRLSSAHHDPTTTMTTMTTSSSSSYTRVSAEVPAQTGAVLVSTSRPSSKGMKRSNNNASHEREESQSTLIHKTRVSQSDSLRRASSSHDDDDKGSYEDAAALQEFDDLMRSASTMKVSLTPDRLRTMEAYKQERDQRAQKDLTWKVEFGRRPSLRQVESIVEDEEEGVSSKQPLPSRHRQGSVASSPSPSLISLTSRNRSLSMSAPGSRAFGKKVIRNVAPPISSSHLFQTTSPPSPTHIPNMQHSSSYPSRTRKVQRNLEAMNLDDIMNGSDDEQPKLPATPRAAARPGRSGLSPTTKDLIAFLAEGPPDPFRTGGDPFDSPNGSLATDSTKKNQGRLQRMISKLSLGGSEKIRPAEDRGQSKQPPPISTKPSALANKPIPPRYPRPPSPPPSSPSSSEEPTPTRLRPSVAQDPNARMARPTRQASLIQTAGATVHPKRDNKENTSKHQGGETNDQASNSNFINHHAHKSPASVPPEKIHPISPAHSQANIAPSPTRKPVPPLDHLPPPPNDVVPSSKRSTPTARLLDADVHEMQRLMSQAGTADECRLILDMFLAKSGIKIDHAQQSATALPLSGPPTIDPPLENAVVELLLSGEVPLEIPNSPRKLRSKRHKKGLTLRPHTADGTTSPQLSPVLNTPVTTAAS